MCPPNSLLYIFQFTAPQATQMQHRRVSDPSQPSWFWLCALVLTPSMHTLGADTRKSLLVLSLILTATQASFLNDFPTRVSVCGCPCSRTPITGVGPTLGQYDCISTWSYLQRPCLQIKSQSQFGGLGLLHILGLGGGGCKSIHSSRFCLCQ